MAISLVKGQKVAIPQSKLMVGVGWEQNGDKFDLDLSVFALNTNKKIISEDYFVFFGNLKTPDGSIIHSGDNRTGEDNSNTDKDDEKIFIDVTKFNESINELIFVLTIHQPNNKNKNFGMVRDSFIRVVDTSNGEELCKYCLDEDFSIETALVFGRLYKRDGSWKFDAVGEGSREDLEHFVNKYYDGEVISE